MKEKHRVFKNQEEIIKVDINEMLAVTCKGYCATLYYGKTMKRFSFCKSLIKVEEEFKDYSKWVRINRNAIISLKKIESLRIKSRDVVLEGGLKLKVSVRNMQLLCSEMKSD